MDQRCCGFSSAAVCIRGFSVRVGMYLDSEAKRDVSQPENWV